MSILIKPGVVFTERLSPSGARILEAIKKIAKQVPFDICITSAADGVHSGPKDPHFDGSAFDIRTQSLTKAQKATLLAMIQGELYAGAPFPQSTQRRFYAVLESPETGNEHIHVQKRLGTEYSTFDFLANL